MSSISLLISKLLFILFIIILSFINFYKNENYYINYKIPKFLKIKTKNKIKIGIYANYLTNGGRARITTILVNYFNKINIFDVYLYTLSNKSDNEYKTPIDTKRIIIKNNLILKILENKIDILIYQLTNIKEINSLNNIKKIKVIFYLHSSIFYWIYGNDYNYFINLYKAYKNSKYVITLVPLENDYLFKKWGIKSILMNNFMTYDYYSVIPSDLSSKTILMIGRAGDKNKRFEIGIKAMKYIIKEIPESKIKIISSLSGTKKLKKLIRNLNLENNIIFVGYTMKPEKYFKDASLNIFPTLTEGFPMVLCETKIYGIPNILLGLNYVSISQGGTVIIYDDNPLTVAKESIKILKNDRYRKKLGKDARKSMKKYNNKLLIIKWIKLILSIYKGDYYFDLFRKKDKQMSNKKALNILNRQIKLIKMRLKRYKYIDIKKLENFTYLQTIKI